MPKPKEENTVRFINYVRCYPLLWDKAHSQHKNFHKRTEAWNAIATLCGYQNGELAKRKWKHLTTARAGAQKIAESSNGISQNSEYLYALEMNFLDGIKRRKRRSGASCFKLLSNLTDQNTLMEHVSNRFEMSTTKDNLTDSCNPNEKCQAMIAHSHTIPCTSDDPNDVNADTSKQLLLDIEALVTAKKSSVCESRTDGALFGCLVGNCLDRLDARRRAQAQLEIQNLLFRYEFEE